jgi:hypothetical protein
MKERNILLLNLIKIDHTTFNQQLKKIEEEIEETKQELYKYKYEKTMIDDLVSESLDILQSSLTLIHMISKSAGMDLMHYLTQEHRKKLINRKHEICGNCYIEFEIKENV